MGRCGGGWLAGGGDSGESSGRSYAMKHQEACKVKQLLTECRQEKYPFKTSFTCLTETPLLRPLCAQRVTVTLTGRLSNTHSVCLTPSPSVSHPFPRPSVSHPVRLSHSLSVCLTSILSVPRLRRLSYTLSVCLTPIPSVPRLHRLSHTIYDCLAPSPSVSHPLRLPHLLFLLVQCKESGLAAMVGMGYQSMVHRPEPPA